MKFIMCDVRCPFASQFLCPGTPGCPTIYFQPKQSKNTRDYISLIVFPMNSSESGDPLLPTCPDRQLSWEASSSHFHRVEFWNIDHQSVTKTSYIIFHQPVKVKSCCDMVISIMFLLFILFGTKYLGNGFSIFGLGVWLDYHHVRSSNASYL